MNIPERPPEEPRLRVSQISLGRFHHFHLARELERRGVLESIFTGYPKFKLRSEPGIPREKIRSFPWLHSPFMVRGRLGLTGEWLSREWAWRAMDTLDRFAAKRLGDATALVALSGTGFWSGRALQRRGGVYICDRGSSHIGFQDEILREEFRRWDVAFMGIDPRVVAREEAEYAAADRVTVPSEFAYRTFVERGVSAEKIVKIPYGVSLDRFVPGAGPDPRKFSILFIGRVGLRKGFPYLLEAFSKFRHPGKELVIVGNVLPEVYPALRRFSADGVRFVRHVPNADLPAWFQRARVLVLPSIEDGYGMVQAEAMACGCPVIASANTGASDLFEDGREGFVVPIRSAEAILEKLDWLAQDEARRLQMAEAAMRRVRRLGGWDRYGEAMITAVQTARNTR